MKYSHYDSDFNEVCFQLLKKQISIGSDNGLALSRGQAIAWTSDDAIQWHIHASPRINTDQPYTNQAWEACFSVNMLYGPFWSSFVLYYAIQWAFTRAFSSEMSCKHVVTALDVLITAPCTYCTPRTRNTI